MKRSDMSSTDTGGTGTGGTGTSGTGTSGESAFELYGDGTLPEDADLMAPNAKQSTPDSTGAASDHHDAASEDHEDHEDHGDHTEQFNEGEAAS